MFSRLGLININKSFYSFMAIFYVGPIFRYFMLFNFNQTYIFKYLLVKVADSKYRLNRREQKFDIHLIFLFL